MSSTSEKHVLPGRNAPCNGVETADVTVIHLPD
jgi:hypothetical protein